MIDTQQATTTRAATTGDAGDANTLVESHLDLIDHVVHQVAQRFPRHVDREELRAAAAAGLVDAAHRYDQTTGVPFARYAAIRMRGAVIDVSRTRDWATRRLRRDLRAIESVRQQLEERLHRAPDDEEIANELGMDVERVRERQASHVTSTLLTLDRPITTDDDGTDLLADRVTEDDPAWLPEVAAERNELVATLTQAVANLPEELRAVLVAHHFEGRLLRDIADELGVTEARASQLRYEALRALQAYFGTLYDEIPSVPDDAPGKRRRAAYVASLQAQSDFVGHIAADREVRVPVERELKVG